MLNDLGPGAEEQTGRPQLHKREPELPSTVELNPTTVYATDRQLSAESIAAVLGPKVGAPFGPFSPVDLGNGLTLDRSKKRHEPIRPQHCAFLVPDQRFGTMITRLERPGSPATSAPRP